MNLQVLVSTMHQTDHSILDKMNIQSDAIVINQCDRNSFEEFDYNGNSVRFLSLAERGVGLSRNTSLMRATAEICLFADDDVTYVNEYKRIILDSFASNPKADVIMFNVPSTNPDRVGPTISKWKRLHFYNCFRYGTFQIAVRTESIRKANISFSLLFGGGAKYSSGEDSLFINDCLKKGLKLYRSPDTIGSVTHKESTWFHGYTDKYFIDKGVFFSCLSKKWAVLYCLQFIFRHYKLFIKEKSILEAYRLMIKGTRLIAR
ncbi:glycosyltransferase family A protein [Lutispora sp.]|uniref:glycosyltransferase family A protein n=1 Tax=Lutispora sp. TaxID=2828727 RepID=UPI00356B23A9